MPLDLPAELVEKAARELNETPERRAVALEELRGLLEKLKHPPSRGDDAYLLRYLRWSKFNVRKAFGKLRNMENFLHDNAHILDNINPEEFRDMYKEGFQRVLSGRDKDGCLISVLLPSRMKNAPSAEMLLRWSVWALDVIADDPHTQVNGYVVIENFDGYSMMDMQTMRKIPASTMMKLFHFQQSCAPFRLKGIYVFNQPKFVGFLWAMVKPFMTQKMKQRVRFFGSDMSAIKEMIDEAVLPPEFGGTCLEDPSVWLENKIAEWKDSSKPASS